jgi:hypothetical protein
VVHTTDLTVIRNLHGGGGGGFGRGGGAGGGPGGFGILAIDMSKPFKSGSVLLVTDVLHPIDDFPHQSLLNGNVRHSSGRACAVPMLLTRWKPDHVAWPDLLDGTTPNAAPVQGRT